MTNTTNTYYAILVIGYGKRSRYCIKRVTERGHTPVTGIAYKTEEAARAAAAEMGIEIKRVGDCYSIFH